MSQLFSPQKTLLWDTIHDSLLLDPYNGNDMRVFKDFLIYYRISWCVKLQKSARFAWTIAPGE